MTPTVRLALVTLAACATPKHPHLVHIAPPPPPAPLVIHADPQLVELTADPSATLAAAGTKSQLAIRFRIRGKQPADAARPQINLGLVVDTSGSMEGKSIEGVRASARELIGKLHDGDRVAIVTFDSTARVLIPSAVIGPANREHIQELVAHLEPRGTTALYEGLAAGFSQLQAGRLPQGINRLVLLSDGVPNASAGLPALVAQIHSSGVSVTSLGIGLDYDTALMTQIARDTGGSFTFIDKPEQVAKVFDDELAKMTTVVGRNLQLAVQHGPGVTLRALPGMVNGGDGKLYVTIGDLAAGETRDIVVPAEVAARADGSVVELAAATLGFDDMIGHSGHRERDAYVGIKASADLAQVHASLVPELEGLRVRAVAAAAIVEAMDLARSGNVAQARARISAALEEVRAAYARTHDPALPALIAQLIATEKQLAQIVVPSGTRELANPTNAPQPIKAPAIAPASVEQKLRATEQDASDMIRGTAPRTPND